MKGKLLSPKTNQIESNGICQFMVGIEIAKRFRGTVKFGNSGLNYRCD
jgi:hypothetical protein